MKTLIVVTLLVALGLSACAPPAAPPATVAPTLAPPTAAPPTTAVPTATAAAATPTVVSTATAEASPVLPPEAVLEAQAWLAEQLGVSTAEVTLRDAEQAEWPDACLGLGQPNEACLQVITPGWQATFEVAGQTYELRTDETGDQVRQASPTPAGHLAGTSWQLVSFTEQGTETPVVDGAAVTLAFDTDGRATGSGGCNRYGADYEAQTGTLSFSPIVSTKIACTEGGLMEQEQRYFEALQSATRFDLIDEQLVITYPGGVLNFAAAAAPVEPPAETYDDQAAPISLLASYVDALNRQEFERAYQYWETPPAATLEEFAAGFSDTASTELLVGTPPGLEGAAGSVFASVPTVLAATHTDGSQHLFSGCYVARRSNVSQGASPDDNPWQIFQGTLEASPAGADVLSLLAQACPAGPDVPYEDQSTPADLLGAYYNAINRQDYARAYGYWETPPEPTLEQFTSGFADTESVQVVVRPPARLGAAAGSQYADLPALLAATQTDGTQQFFAGCFTARRPSPGLPGAPPGDAWQFYAATVTEVGSVVTAASDVLAELEQACPAR